MDFDTLFAVCRTVDQSTDPGNESDFSRILRLSGLQKKRSSPAPNIPVCDSCRGQLPDRAGDHLTARYEDPLIPLEEITAREKKDQGPGRAEPEKRLNFVELGALYWSCRLSAHSIRSQRSVHPPKCLRTKEAERRIKG